MIDWAQTIAEPLGVDSSQLIRGVRMGVNYAMRAAHTHSRDLIAVAAQGGCSHHVFDPAWIAAQNQMEFSYLRTCGDACLQVRVSRTRCY